MMRRRASEWDFYVGRIEHQKADTIRYREKVRKYRHQGSTKPSAENQNKSETLSSERVLEMTNLNLGGTL